MYTVTICTLISSLSFFAYAFSYFNTPHMKREFKRFGLEKIGLTTVVLEIIGAVGLLVGLKFHFNSNDFISRSCITNVRWPNCKNKVKR